MAKSKGPIKKSHFKDYDRHYKSDMSMSTGETDSEGDASSRVANQKMMDDVQKDLWANAKVSKNGDYIIPKKAWDKFFKSLEKDINKYGASSGEGDDA